MNPPLHVRARESQRSPVLSLVYLLASLCTLWLLASCSEVDPTIEAPPSVVEQAEQSSVYDHPAGYCQDESSTGIPYSPARPLWSDLAGAHYDGISFSDGSSSIRYPDYENISHNLAIEQTLQFILSMLNNVSARLESAQQMLEEGTYIDAALGAITPQVDGHCVCTTGGCTPETVLADAEAAIEDLISVHTIDELLEEILMSKVYATIDDLNDLVAYFEGLIDPSGGVTTILGAALRDAILQEFGIAQSAFDAAVSGNACDPAIIESAVVDAVETELSELEAELVADFNTVQSAVDLGISLPSSVLTQLQTDIEVVREFFMDVESFGDLIRLDWAALIAVLEDSAGTYEGYVNQVTTAIEDLTGVWENITNFDARIEQLGDDTYAAIMSNLQAHPNSAACVSLVQSAASYISGGGYNDGNFAANLEAALQGAIESIWDDARARVQLTVDNIEERITGILSGEAALSALEAQLLDARSVITGALESCYMRGTRSECFDHCGATASTAQGDFLWMPTDFLQSPENIAAGAANGAMFALSQAGFLDDFVEWVDDNMGSALGGAITSALAVVADLTETIEQVQEFLGEFLGYVDRFSEGYHLGAYSELRPDLHMCIGYAGHGAYAQMGNLGNDDFSVGARYTSHNLSRRHRVQFRSGGFGVSAFGYELSIAPSIEFNTQMNGWRLWDQTRPFGIPLNVNLNSEAVGRLDVFNVVPMDQYPFGFSENVPVGAFLVRDLYPSRATATSTPQWPRPSVAEPWENQSTAVVSMGLNLELDFGPWQWDLPTIPIFTGVTMTPWFRLGFGMAWLHDTNHMRQRVQDMINEGLPASSQLSTADFERDMHAMQAPDLTADDGTTLYVQPEMGVELHVGINLGIIKFGIGANLGLAVNIQPGGFGVVVDLNAALADALVNSNPPAEAECTPLWSHDTSYSCNNVNWPDSSGEYSCEPESDNHYCCANITLHLEDRIERLNFCIDEWTGMTQEICEQMAGLNQQVEDFADVLNGLPSFLSFLTDPLGNLLDVVQRVDVTANWGSGMCSDEAVCPAGDIPFVVNTGILNVQEITECALHGYCVYSNGTTIHDMAEADCESSDSGLLEAYAANGDTDCVMRPDRTVSCFDTTTEFAFFEDDYVGGCGIRDDASVVCTGTWHEGEFGKGIDVTIDADQVCVVTEDYAVECTGTQARFPVGNAFPDQKALVADMDSSRSLSTTEMLCIADIEGNVWCRHCSTSSCSDVELRLRGDYVEVAVLQGLRGPCALNSAGEILCDVLAAPGVPAQLPGTYVSLSTFYRGLGICGLTTAGNVRCFGEPDSRMCPAPDPELLFRQFDSSYNAWHGILEDGRRIAQDDNCELRVYDPLTADWYPYACMPQTESEVTGWTGDGCHPLQHGFPSACACENDSHCGGGEFCGTETGVCMVSSTQAADCMCGPGNSCTSGRSCVNGACMLVCVLDSDCPSGRTCESGTCATPHDIPTSEEISWGMDNIGAPTHVVSSYAMSEIQATLIFTFDFFVEATINFGFFKRTWTIFDFSEAYDLGSTWKGWYQPGLEAFYEDECADPALSSAVTNRYPQSLTTNPWDGNFIADGVGALFSCPSGGVCRYPDSLPPYQTDPADYTTGNAGDVEAFVEWCKYEMAQHAEDPDPSTTDDIVTSVGETAEWGYNVGYDVWINNQICIDGVVWDDWVADLEPTFDEDGNLLDPGGMGVLDCVYDDPSTGASYTFSCSEVSFAMADIWGCNNANANPMANLLASGFPSLIITSPYTGANVFDIDQMFTESLAQDPNGQSVLSMTFDQSNMIPAYRFYSVGFTFAIGQQWVQALGACMEQRYDAEGESTCECATNADCREDFGETCISGACHEPWVTDPTGDCYNADCSPMWVERVCPIVQAQIEPEPCCGDGVVQVTDTYAEECDDGPDGSATCTPDCESIEGGGDLLGACCVEEGLCLDSMNAEACEDEGGTFNLGVSCLSLSYCTDDDVDPPTGACCTNAGCLSAVDAGFCALQGGTFHQDQTCVELDYCVDASSDLGACCKGDDCIEAVSPQTCAAAGGAHHPGQSCAEINYCDDINLDIGACCLDGACFDAIPVYECIAAGGQAHPNQTCASGVCADPASACCTLNGCIDGLSPPRCAALDGDYYASQSCADINYCEDTQVLGSCCTDYACLDAVSEDECTELGGSFNDTVSCEDRTDCVFVIDEYGSCCAGDQCYDNYTALRCRAINGTFQAGVPCVERLDCRDTSPVRGSCCTDTECIDGIEELSCRELGGSFAANTPCETRRDCVFVELGSCCTERGCIDAVDETYCRERDGEFSLTLTCDERECQSVSPVRGSCCTDTECIDGIEELSCRELGGSFAANTLCSDREDCEFVVLGACCTERGCIQGVDQTWCDEREGEFNPGRSCDEVDCRMVSDLRGSCCTGDSCYEDLTAPACEELGGSFAQGVSCAARDDCDGAQEGSCCLNGACIDNIPREKCENEGGIFNAALTCEERDDCDGNIINGACCEADGSCTDGSQPEPCQESGGVFVHEETCESINYCRIGDFIGACCTPEGQCLESVSLSECQELGGQFQEGVSCDECTFCAPVQDFEEPSSGCSSTSRQAPKGGTWLLPLIALVALRRRRRA